MKEKHRIASRMVTILSGVLLLVQCGGKPDMTDAARDTVVGNLADLAQLKQVFNGDQGRVRILALLSPT